MARNSKSLRFLDFSGGLNTAAPVTTLNANESLDLQNINLLPSGGFEKRRGNTTFNSSAMVSSSTAISGLGYFRLANNSDFLMAIAGTKIFSSSSLSGTMSDVTGSVTITTGQDNVWTHSTMSDVSIFVGGAPNPPIRYTGSGNAAALAGSPPSGNFGIAANNRMFIGNTSAAPSTIYWSILGSVTDWSGTGSGSQIVGGSDGDVLIGAAVLNTNHMLLFKQNSIHDMVITTAPFPVFTLFRGVGAISKRAIVNVDGMIYFITPQARMKATDGTKIYDFPEKIDDVWDGLNQSRLKYIHGQYYPSLQQIWWFCSYGAATTHDYCIIWDLRDKCWLRHTTGYSMNSSVVASDKTIYGGAYDGKIYKMDVASTYTDASETAGTINAYWRSGWMDQDNSIELKLTNYLETCLTAQTTGTYEFGYGFDFSSDRKIVSNDMVGPGNKWNQFNWNVGNWSGLSDLTKLIFIKGKGKYFQYLIRNNNNNEAFKFNGIQIPMKTGAPFALRSN